MNVFLLNLLIPGIFGSYEYPIGISPYALSGSGLTNFPTNLLCRVEGVGDYTGTVLSTTTVECDLGVNVEVTSTISLVSVDGLTVFTSPVPFTSYGIIVCIC